MKYLLASLCLALCLPACSEKKEEAPAAQPAAGDEKTHAEAKAEPANDDEPPETDEEPALEEDYLRVQISHAKVKPSDPVHLEFGDVKILESSFDPANLEGATATIEVAIASLKSDKKGRDEHLMQPDYLDQAAFPTAKAVVSDVRAAGDGAYTAKVEMTIHGQSQTWQLSFTTPESTDSSVTIQFEHQFKRTAFGIGTLESSPSDDVILRGRLTFRK